jgi:hypothetical protein
VQEKANRPGFLVFAPAYRKHTPLVTVEDRRSNLLGFVLGVFHIGDIVEHSLTHLKQQQINLTRYDQSAPKNEGFLCLFAWDSPLKYRLSLNRAKLRLISIINARNNVTAPAP